jgi:putative ABC transport system permease protein
VQSPYVFASFRTAQTLGDLAGDTTKYVLVTVRPGADRAEVKRALGAKMPTVDIHDTATFAHATQLYWLFATGAGLDLVVSAFLGVVIGVVITAQTLYASAVDHLPEYATLRAMGASDRYLKGVITKQSVISAAIGYAVGISISALLIWSARDSEVPMLLPWQLVVVLAGVTVGMCLLSGLVAMRRVITINPTVVFR